jgi:outer membrane receptor for ferrienterochelin and colicins
MSAQQQADALALDSLLGVKVSPAAKYALRLGEVASSITVVTSEDIERYGYRSLDDVLAGVPGFYSSNDRNYVYIGVRGFSRPSDFNNRLLLLIDGNTANENMWGSVQIGADLPFPLRHIDRIEIVRGPGSALFGTGAIFGVINIITKAPATLNGGELTVEGGSFGWHSAQAHAGRRLTNGLALSVAATLDRSSGIDQFFPEYDTPEENNGIASGLDYERRGTLMFAATKGPWRLHGRYASRFKAIPTGAYESLFNARESFTRDEFSFLELTHQSRPARALTVDTRTYFNSYLYRGGYPSDVNPDGTTWSLHDRTLQQAIGNEASLRWDLGSGNRLTLGTEVRHSPTLRYASENSLRVEELLIDQPSTTLSAYVQDEHQLSREVSLLAGVRYDRYRAGLQAVSPRLAVIVAPSRETVVKVLYGSAFRAPSMYEAEIESEGYERNAGLQPEVAQTLELVAQRRLTGDVELSMSAFQYRMQRLIDLTVDPETDMYVYRNVGSARSRGLEAGLTGRFGARANGYANYTLQRTINESGERLTNSPKHLVKLGGGVTATPWLRPALQVRYESGRRTVYDTWTSDFALADVYVALMPALLRRRPRGASVASEPFEVTLRVNNLFDARYATPGGVEHRQAAIVQDGRSVRVQARMRF